MRGDVIVKTLEKERDRKQKRADLLEAKMTAKHLDWDATEEFNRLVPLFNAAKGADKLAIAEKMKAANDRHRAGVAKAKTQNNNYMKWMNEQQTLMGDVCDLKNEISTINFRARTG